MKRKIYEKGSFFYNMLNSHSWREDSFLDDVSLHHWARKHSFNKVKSLLKRVSGFLSSKMSHWEYFGSSIASKLRSKQLV